jgi:hypothetical protein
MIILIMVIQNDEDVENRSEFPSKDARKQRLD